MRTWISPGLWKASMMTLLTALSPALQADSAAATAVTLTHVHGRVILRLAEPARMEFPKIGRTIAHGLVLVTGDQARLELSVGESGGLWRLGRRAVFIPQAGGGRLTAGTALVRVPSGVSWRVEGARGAVRLGEGLWMLQAVDNEGLKLVCLDGPAEADALGEGAAIASDAVESDTVETRRIKLRPGELVFLRPGGMEFGPIVTIYLEELLATSRLVNGFPEPLPQAGRLRNLGIAQREQLKTVTNALVAGAPDDEDFEIVVPKARKR